MKKKNQSEKPIYYIIPITWQLEKKRQNYRDSKNTGGCQGFWEKEGGTNRWDIGNYWDGEIILYDIVMMDTGHYAFVKSHRMYNTKGEA